MPRHRLHSAALSLLLLAAAVPAHAADDWSPAFPADAVATHLPGKALKLVVVGAGEPSDALTDALDALVAAARSADSVDLVMDAAALGDVSTLDDAAVVHKAQALPVDRVVVLRVFAAKSGATAAVSVYDKAGEAAGGFTATLAQPVKPAANAGGSAAGVAVGAVMKDASSDKSAALQEFSERVVWFEGGNWVDSTSGAVVGTWTQPYQGKYKEPLNGREFYTTIGADDALADWDVNQRKARRNGAITAGVSGVATLSLALMAKNASSYETGKIVGGITGATLTGIVFLGSVPAAIGGKGKDPRTMPEKRRMAEEYNKELLSELGLTNQDLQSLSAPAAPRAPAVRWFGGPMALPQGGGLTFGGAF